MIAGVRAAAGALAPALPGAGLSSYEWITKYLGIPAATIKWSLDPRYAEHEWDGTKDPLFTMLELLDNYAVNGIRAVAVESATGTGKTFMAACLALAFMARFPNPYVLTSAPKQAQLELHMWREVSRMWAPFQRLFPAAHLGSLDMRLVRKQDHRGLMTALVSAKRVGQQSAVTQQGHHAADMLIITEETPGMELAAMASFEQTCTAPHNLRVAFGNPDFKSDALHQMAFNAAGQPQPGVAHIRISALDHPNVVCEDDSIVPGAVGLRSIEERKKKYGIDSTFYKSRVRGICPDQSSDALIRLEWIRQCVRLGEDPKTRAEMMGAGLKALGVDVANSNQGDKAAIAHGIGAVCTLVESVSVGEGHRISDCNVLGAHVVSLMRANGINPDRVGVDPIGVGAGTVNEMTRLKARPRSLGGADAVVSISGMQEEFPNLRSQMHWQARLDIQDNKVVLPDDEELHADLCEVRWEPKNGKIVVESKETIVERLGRSPDKGDAFVYWNWVRQHRGQTSRGAKMVTF